MTNVKSPMTPAAASRIQSHPDRTGTNQGFKSRAQASAAKQSAGKTQGGRAGAGKGKR